MSSKATDWPGSTKRDYSRYTSLGLHLENGIMTVTLANPGRRNAVTPAMNGELMTIWDDVGADPEVRAVILTGAGEDFCSGVDIDSLQARYNRKETPAGPVHTVTRAARRHLMSLLDCEKPVVAKIRGVAYGMGVNLALACDMVFAAEGARLCDSHVRAGMAAGDGGVLLWPLAIGFHRAKQYLMTGRPITAEVADRVGLINACLPDAELDAHVQAMVEDLCSLPPHAVNYTKMALNVAMKSMASAAFETSLAYELYTMRTDDFKEATAAFVEKRPASYQGR